MNRANRPSSSSSKSRHKRDAHRSEKPKRQQMTNNNGENYPTVWTNLDEAKRKQESIRNRLRKYGRDEKDSDYSDSISSSDSDSDSDEYDDEFDLNIRRNSGNVGLTAPPRTKQPKPEQYLLPISPTVTPTSTPTKKEKKFGNLLRQSLKSSIRSSNNSGSNNSNKHGSSTNNSQKQLRSSMKSQTQQDSPNAQKREKLPPLTPAEATRLVMERHAYISDSDESDDEHQEEEEPIMPRIPPQQRKSSFATVATTATTCNSEEHNRTGKRVLTLKKKKFREDTHPRTSNMDKTNYREQRQPPQQHQRHHQKQQQQQDYQPTNPIQPPMSHPQTRNNEEKIDDYRNRYYKNEDDEEDEGEDKEITTSMQIRYNASNPPLKKGDEDFQYDHNNNQDNKNSQERALAAALANEALSKKSFLREKNKEKNECFALEVDNDTSSDDDDEYDENFLGEDEDIVQRSLDHSNHNSKATATTNTSPMTSASEHTDTGATMGQKGNENNVEEYDVDSIDPTHGVDEESNEEDWGQLSFKTAKTSKSVTSRYSKASATALWMRAMEGEDYDDVDDIFFFDAIQEVGGGISRSVVKVSGDPPTIITDGNVKNDLQKVDMSSGEEDDNEDEGWTGKLTNLVGYTIGALAGNIDYNEHDNDPKSSPKTTSFVAAKSTKDNSLPKKKKYSKVPASNVNVPSRELEIIKKCQEQMKVQHREVERRKIEAARNDVQNIELRRREEVERARVNREVMNYRKMMEGMGKVEKLAPLDSKEAAQEYDDRLAMDKTLDEQEKKIKLNERNMMNLKDESNNDTYDDETDVCSCRCIIS